MGEASDESSISVEAPESGRAEKRKNTRFDRAMESLSESSRTVQCGAPTTKSPRGCDTLSTCRQSLSLSLSLYLFPLPCAATSRASSRPRTVTGEPDRAPVIVRVAWRVEWLTIWYRACLCCAQEAGQQHHGQPASEQRPLGDATPASHPPKESNERRVTAQR